MVLSERLLVKGTGVTIDLLTKGLPIASALAKNRVDLWILIAGAANCARHITEVGVWEGQFAAGLLRGLPSVESYHLIDPWRPLSNWSKPCNVDEVHFEQARQQAMEATAFAGEKVTVMRGETAEVSHRIADGSQDLIYIDGDHTLRGITIDLMLMLGKVRQSGLIGGDDYMDDPWHHGEEFEPSLVAPYACYFAEAMQLPFVALPHSQFLIVNDPVGFSVTNLSGKPLRSSVGRPPGT